MRPRAEQGDDLPGRVCVNSSDSFIYFDFMFQFTTEEIPTQPSHFRERAQVADPTL